MNGNTIQKPISKEKELFPNNIFGKPKDIIERKEILDKVKKELEEKKNYKPELTILEIIEKQKLNAEFLKACLNGNLEKVKELLIQGVDINTQDDKGWTGLKNASWSGKTECVLFLLQHPKILADMKILTKEFTKASDRGDLKYVKELLAKVDVNIKNNEEKTALILASRHKNTECVSVILNDPRTDVNIKDGFGNTALMYASEYRYTDIVSLLLQHPKIDVNVRNDNSQTALMEAVSNGHYDIVSLLIDAGADVQFNYLHKIGFKNLIKYVIRKVKEI